MVTFEVLGMPSAFSTKLLQEMAWGVGTARTRHDVCHQWASPVRRDPTGLPARVSLGPQLRSVLGTGANA